MMMPVDLFPGKLGHKRECRKKKKKKTSQFLKQGNALLTKLCSVLDWTAHLVKLISLIGKSAMTRFSPNIQIKGTLTQTLNHNEGWISVSITQIINSKLHAPNCHQQLSHASQSPTLFLPPTSMQWSFAATNSQAVCGDECGAEPDPSPESTEIIQHDDRKPARVLTSSVALEDQQGFPSTYNQ